MIHDQWEKLTSSFHSLTAVSSWDLFLEQVPKQCLRKKKKKKKAHCTHVIFFFWPWQAIPKRVTEAGSYVWVTEINFIPERDCRNYESDEKKDIKATHNPTSVEKIFFSTAGQPQNLKSLLLLLHSFNFLVWYHYFFDSRSFLRLFFSRIKPSQSFAFAFTFHYINQRIFFFFFRRNKKNHQDVLSQVSPYGHRSPRLCSLRTHAPFFP